MKLSVIVPSLDGLVPESLTRYAAEYPEVELVIVKGMSPVSAARNEGLRRATGDYIAWVDADDDITPDYFKEITSILQLPLTTTTSSPSIISFNIRVEWHDGSNRPSYFLDGRATGQLWRKVFRRSLFDGLTFEGAVHEDYRIQCQMPRDLVHHHIDKVLYVYKRRASGLSQHHDFMASLSALWGLIKICNSWDMFRGILERAWDLAKTPLRKILRSKCKS